MRQFNASDLPRRGFRTYSVNGMPGLSSKQKLRSMLTAQSFEFLEDDIREHGAIKWKVKEIKPLSDTHPDKVCGGHTYTHTVRILYKPKDRPGTWECIYAITEAQCIHLWMD